MDLKYKDITEKVIGAAMKVHSALGNGFQEVIYQRAMVIEMPYEDLQFEREKEMEARVHKNEHAHKKGDNHGAGTPQDEVDSHTKNFGDNF